MRSSRLGIFVIILATVLIGTNCSYYNRIIARKNLVDGAAAYKDRKFQVAEELFRKTIATDPEIKTDEAKTAQLFLARTLHSQFVANRKDTPKADEAIAVYKAVLAKDITDQGSFKAVANLLENTNRQDEWLTWVTERTTNNSVPPEQRAEALTSLAARKYSCANDISDIEPVKKTVQEGGKQVYKFSKPENPADFEKLKQCTDEGLTLINNALDLQKQANVESDSTWSYKANLLVQKMRIAEMDGDNAAKDQFKKEADVAKEKFSALAAERKRKEEEEEARKKAAEEAANKK